MPCGPNAFSAASYAARVWKDSGSVATPALPVWIPAYGTASATSTATPATRLIAGRRSETAATRDHTPPPSRRPSSGTRRRSRRSPRTASTAGSSVSAASTETRTTAIAPAAIERKIVWGTRNMPTSASTTVAPENSTARLAVAPATATASGTDAARAALLAEARDHEQRVVDPDRQPHHHQHVDDDEVQDERLADERGDRQRHDDAGDRHRDRHDRGRHAAEDDDEHDQRE